jgi:F-box and WD-40 domain protein 1/11
VQASFGDLPGNEDELEAEAKAIDRKFFEAREKGLLDGKLSRERRRARNAGSRDPRDIFAYGAKLPPGGGGSRWGRIVSGSYDESVIIWKKEPATGKWVVGRVLLQNEAVRAAGIQRPRRAGQPVATVLAQHQQAAQGQAQGNAGNNTQVGAGQPSSQLQNMQTSLQNLATQAHQQIQQAHMLAQQAQLLHQQTQAAHIAQQAAQQLQQQLSTNPSMSSQQQQAHLQQITQQLQQQLQQQQQQMQAQQQAAAQPGPATQGGPQVHPQLQVAQQQAQQQPQQQIPHHHHHNATTAGTAATASASTAAPITTTTTTAAGSSTNLTTAAPGAAAGPQHQQQHHHHHHHPHPLGGLSAAAATAAATQQQQQQQGGGSRVFKLQFDARRIICCSQDPTIVGWDFAAGDREIMEASRFFGEEA